VLCAISACCEVAGAIALWPPIPAKICTLSGLKAISIACKTIRDLCVAKPNGALCK